MPTPLPFAYGCANYLDMLPDDVMDYIIQVACNQVSKEIEGVASSVSYERFYRTIKATDDYPKHLMLDNMFHISASLDIDMLIRGPVSIKFHDIFSKGFYGMEKEEYIMLKYDGDILLKDVLIKVVRHLGRHEGLKDYDVGVSYNCISNIIYNGVWDHDEDEFATIDKEIDEERKEYLELGEYAPRHTELIIKFNTCLYNYADEEDEKDYYFKKTYNNSTYIKVE